MADAVNHQRHIIIFALITALCLLGDSMLYIVLPIHYQEMGVSSLWEVGIILAVNRIVRLPLNPCIGWLYAHVSERTGIFIAVLLAIGTTFSYGLLPNLALWILARCVWGFAWTLLRLGSLFCIVKLSGPDKRGHYTGLYNGLYRLGSLAGMLLGGLLADLAGIKVTAMVLGAATVPALILAVFFIPGGKGRQESHAGTGGTLADLVPMARDKNTLWLLTSGCLTALVFQGVVASTLSRLIFEHTGGGLQIFGFLAGASMLGGFFQALRWAWEPWLAPLTGRLSDQRFTRMSMLYFACVLGALSFAALASPLPLALWFSGLLCMQLTATMLTTLNDAAATDAAASAGERMLLMTYALIVDVGAAMGPLLAYGMNALFSINAVYAGCALLLIVLADRWRVAVKVGQGKAR